jgi:hypothetical protein
MGFSLSRKKLQEMRQTALTEIYTDNTRGGIEVVANAAELHVLFTQYFGDHEMFVNIEPDNDKRMRYIDTVFTPKWVAFCLRNATILAFRGLAFARLHVCTFARLHVCTFARLHVCTFARLHVCTFAFVYVRACVFAE